MNNFYKFSAYLALFFFLVALTALVSNVRYGTDIKNIEQLIDRYHLQAPFSVVLTNYFSSGIFFKSYYQRYKIVRNNESREILVKVSPQLFNHYHHSIGLSILCQAPLSPLVKVATLPGGCFVGDRTLGYFHNGRWIFFKKYLPLQNEMIVISFEQYEEITRKIERGEDEQGASCRPTFNDYHLDFSRYWQLPGKDLWNY